LATCVVIGFIVTGFIANAQAGSRATQNDVALVIGRLIGSWTFLLAIAAPSLLFVALGGYVAARAAGVEDARRALPVGLLAVAAMALLIFVTPAHVPVALALALLAAPVPAALVGVNLRKMVVRRGELRESEPAPRAAPSFPRPPAHSIEDEREYAAQVAGVMAREGRIEEPPKWTPAPSAYADSYADAPTEKLEALEGLRAAVRAALMTHPAATEEDFERCWPSIRDEIFKQHTLRVYNSRGARDNGSH
jgi:Ca2+/Na+ antiporter